jgi:hypothetical protein
LSSLIKPFASREEALEAEKRAIRQEFPRFNKTHNERRHPADELRRIVKGQEAALLTARLARAAIGPGQKKSAAPFWGTAPLITFPVVKSHDLFKDRQPRHQQRGHSRLCANRQERSWPYAHMPQSSAPPN